MLTYRLRCHTFRMEHPEAVTFPACGKVDVATVRRVVLEPTRLCEGGQR